jgi:hypothetical protein
MITYGTLQKAKLSQHLLDGLRENISKESWFWRQIPIFKIKQNEM